MTGRATKSGSNLDTQMLSFDGQDHLVRWDDTVTTSHEEWYMYDTAGLLLKLQTVYQKEYLFCIPCFEK